MIEKSVLVVTSNHLNYGACEFEVTSILGIFPGDTPIEVVRKFAFDKFNELRKGIGSNEFEFRFKFIQNNDPSTLNPDDKTSIKALEAYTFEPDEENDMNYDYSFKSDDYPGKLEIFINRHAMMG